MKDKLIIVGASGHGKVVADIAINMKRWQRIFFLDDNESIKKSMGIEVIGKTADAYAFRDEAEFVIAIGNNAVRKKIQEQFINEGMILASLIHPHTAIGTEVEIGAGTVVMAGVIINSSTRIGSGCIINTSSSLDHDGVIEDYVHISPGAKVAGGVRIGKGAWIGIGSVVSNNLNICSWCKVGAGGVVVKNITDSGTYVGVPVRRTV